jgi:hypothetical protein
VRSALLFAAVVASAALSGPSARGDGLSSAENSRLLRGETVVRFQSLARGAQHYVGGLAYAIVDAPVDDLAPLLDDVNAWKRILPKTRSARRIGAVGGDALVAMTHGTAFVEASYTMRVHREDNAMRFWMDRRRSHDIEDAWGFLRAEPTADGRTLITYGVLIDIGPGLFRDLFEDSVRRLALSVPDRVRGFVRERKGVVHPPQY